MSYMVHMDDRLDDDPEVIARREKAWNELPPDIREKIDREVAETVARVKAQRNQKQD